VIVGNEGTGSVQAREFVGASEMVDVLNAPAVITAPARCGGFDDVADLVGHRRASGLSTQSGVGRSERCSITMGVSGWASK
jgi:hypothetical protein